MQRPKADQCPSPHSCVACCVCCFRITFLVFYGFAVVCSVEEHPAVGDVADTVDVGFAPFVAVTHHTLNGVNAVIVADRQVLRYLRTVKPLVAVEVHMQHRFVVGVGSIEILLHRLVNSELKGSDVLDCSHNVWSFMDL